jgi:hypothetical protein
VNQELNMNITSLFTVPDNDLQLQLITTVPIQKPESLERLR